MNEEDRMPLADAVDARLESYAREGDFASSWAAAQRRGRLTAVVPLLVAAVVLAVVGFGMLRPEEAGDGQGSSVQVPDDGALHVGVGHAGLLDDPLEGGTARVSVVDEGVAGLRRQGGGFVVSGRSMGRTDVVFEGASGEAVIRTVRVEHEPLSPATTGWVDVPVGGSLVLQGPVSAIDVVDNGVLGVEDIGGPVFTARSQGTTDVVLGSGDRVTVVSVHVGEGGRTHGLLHRPLGDAVTIEPGEARLLDVRATAVSIVDNGVLQARAVGDRVLLEGRSPGYTDVITVDGASRRVFRVTVTR